MKTLLYLFLLAVPFIANQANAQVLEEVVVTAQKREQSIQDVSTSVSALTGNQLQEMGLANTSELSRHIPNFIFGSPVGEGAAPSLSIRGVGIATPYDSSESPVALYIDEVYYGTTIGQTTSLYDMDRVEVLRGPQGTLFGRNTTAGLVHFVTRKPTEEPEAHGTFTYGSWDRINFEGALSGPLGDSMRARISVLHNEHDGYQRDRISGDRGADRKTTALRGQLAIDITEEIEVLFKMHGSDTSGGAYLYKTRGYSTPAGSRCTLDQINALQCFDDFGNRDPVDDPHVVQVNPFTDYNLDVETLGGSAKITWQRDGWELVSITAVEWLEKKHNEPSYAAPGPVPLSAQFNIETDQVTQEARLSHAADDLTWMLGFYYYSDEKDGSFTLLPPIPFGNLYVQEVDSWAVFGHAEWRFMPAWSLEAGVRYTSEETKLASNVDTGFLGIGAFTYSDKVDDDNVPWHVGLNWEATEDVLLFLNIARGYKSGGFNSSGFINFTAQLVPYDAERLTMYEGGIKATLFGGKARLNASGFYYDYKDFQALTQANIGGLPTDRLENAGNAEVYGFEAELFMRPLEFFEAQFGVGYLDTETEDFFSAEGFGPMGEPIFTDLSGTELVYSPEWSANGLMRLFYPIFGGEAAVQVDFSYSDEMFFDTDNDPVDVGADFTLWNLRASWSGPEDRYEIAFFAQNFTDEEYITEGFDFFGGQALIFNKPRSIGVSFSARY